MDFGNGSSMMVGCSGIEFESGSDGGGRDKNRSYKIFKNMHRKLPTFQITSYDV